MCVCSGQEMCSPPFEAQTNRDGECVCDCPIGKNNRPLLHDKVMNTCVECFEDPSTGEYHHYLTDQLVDCCVFSGAVNNSVQEVELAPSSVQLKPSSTIQKISDVLLKFLSFSKESSSETSGQSKQQNSGVKKENEINVNINLKTSQSSGFIEGAISDKSEEGGVISGKNEETTSKEKSNKEESAQEGGFYEEETSEETTEEENIEIKGDIVDLRQQEYRGKRIFLQIFVQVFWN